MGVQATLRDIMSGYLTATAHTANNTDIEAAFDKALDRTANVNNAMQVNLDFGSNRGINLADGVADSDAANMRQLRNAIQDSIAAGTDVADAINYAVDVAVALALEAAGTDFIVRRTDHVTGFADGTTVVNIGFTYTMGVNNLTVYRNGLAQTLGVDYTETSTSSVTFTLPLVSTDRIIFISNDATTTSVASSAAISHDTGAGVVPLVDFLNDAMAIASGTANTDGITHTDDATPYNLETYLIDERDRVDSLVASQTTAWEDETSPSANGFAFTGAVIPFASATARNGWVFCDGAAVSRTTYSRLFSVIGTLYGAGDGSTTFNLPDLRGEFIRGYANGKSGDTEQYRVFGTNQDDALQNITGTFETFDRGTPNVSGAFYDTGSNFSASVSSGASDSWGALYGFNADLVARTDTETRPRNVALAYFIKT